MHRRLIALTVVATLSASCGGDPAVAGGRGELEQAALRLTFELDEPLDADGAAALDAALAERLAAFGVDAYDVLLDGTTLELELPSFLDPAETDALASSGRLSLQAVLAVGPASADGCAVEVVDLDACAELAPPAPGLDAVEVEEATATSIGGQWGVDVTIAPADRAAFGGVLDACATMAPDCPRGQLAVLIDGTVLAAPVVHGPPVADALVRIDGSFTEDEANALAAALGSSLPTGLVLVESLAIEPG